MNLKIVILLIVLLAFGEFTQAAKTIVNSLASLQSAYANAQPGDTIVVANGSYNWGEIILANTNGSSTSGWIVVKAEQVSGVTFTGSTYIKFSGNRIRVDGFKFLTGNAGLNPVISFRSSTTALANYSRLSNITIDNYNSDNAVENEWIGIFGVYNRVDHCTFINKSNPRATVVVWYSTATFPDKSISTYHRIDSNYFQGRSYQGGNGGESIRVGVGNNSKTDGYNLIEYNLFENCSQADPEIVSNKSCHNTYRYNTFKNCNGGLTLRMGRYCEVYGNFFIVNDATKTESYGVRVIDKGHRVYNNYFEGLLGGAGSLSDMRAPLTIYNGSFSSSDSSNPAILNGEYLPADSAVIAFNTVVNCNTGAGIRLGYTKGGANTYPPLGIKLGNNIFKMSAGRAVYLDPANTSLTYSAEGNLYSAPDGLGLSSSTGFTSQTFNFGSRTNGILPPPVAAVQDAAVNTSSYTSLMTGLDAQRQVRSSVYDIGCDELNGTGSVVTGPLDATKAGAGLIIVTNYVYTPLQVSFLNGSCASCVVGNLTTNDASYYVINSTTKGTRKVDWYGSVWINQPVSSINKVTLNYDGKNSVSKTQLLYLYNWTTSSWTQIDSRTVSTSDMTISKVQTTNLTSYFSSTGEIRLRVYSSGGSTNYTCSGDWMQIIIEASEVYAGSANAPANIPLQFMTDKSFSSKAPLQLNVLGNPSSDQFRLRLQGDSQKPFTLQLTDVFGRVHRMITGLYNGQTLQVGADLNPGIYFATLRQENKRVVLKLVKSK